jgi:monoamine oxidase
MARTPLAHELQRAAAAAAPEGVPAVTRRRLLRDAGLAGLTLAVAGRFAAPANPATAPRIVVVGAGLAGLTCAYRLKQAGYLAQVYDAADRVGGRCWTIRDQFAHGQIAEHGGELIDQGHTAIRHLAQELGLKLDNLIQAERNGTDSTYYFDGEPYPVTQATDDLKAVWQKLHSDVSAASYPTLYTGYTQRGFELDHMSIVDWIEESVPGGMSSKLGQLLNFAYNIEYGAESSEQSSLNLLYLLGYSGQGQLRIFGPSNEKYHVRGGNDQIPELLAAGLGRQVTLGSELTEIRVRSDGTYSLAFRSGGAAKPVVADRVVLALPFAVLRASVDYSQAGFKPLKRTSIEELGMGTNSKLHLQFRTRHWESLGSNGDTVADTGYQTTWDVTRAQPGRSGILVDYTGGKIGASFGSGTASSHAEEFLSQLEPVLPGISAQWNRRATLDFWTDYPWTLGSYSYWKVGQYTRFAGVEKEVEGACHFCGEHTSIDFQGYLNGAVETGERAAGEVIEALR